MSKTRGSSVTATNLDQLVFRPGGGHGPQVRASSFETPASGEGWARALEPYLRRAGASADPQTPVLSYVRCPDGQAAVCRRRADPGRGDPLPGGPGADLTAPLAVGLVPVACRARRRGRARPMPQLRRRPARARTAPQPPPCAAPRWTTTSSSPECSRGCSRRPPARWRCSVARPGHGRRSCGAWCTSPSPCSNSGCGPSPPVTSPVRTRPTRCCPRSSSWPSAPTMRCASGRSST